MLKRVKGSRFSKGSRTPGFGLEAKRFRFKRVLQIFADPEVGAMFSHISLMRVLGAQGKVFWSFISEVV